jgi:rSAM/selenodomain-associated transferase 2
LSSEHFKNKAFLPHCPTRQTAALAIIACVSPTLSIVIPTLDAAATLGATLAALDEARAEGFALEILLVDGGSHDATIEIARAKAAKVLPASASRGGQLAQGGAAAQGDWLLFLHADTRLEKGWAREAAGFAAEPANAERAAAFRFALDDGNAAARRIEALVAWRCRRLGLPYGDQGLLVARDFYRALGGFRPLALMEDVDLVRRIGKRRLALLQSRAFTSAARYRREGWLMRPARNLCCLALYFLGLPPHLVRRLYA